MLKFQQWSSDLERIPGFGKWVKKSKEITLPGLQKVPLYDVMRFFGQSLSKGVVFQRAAAITYRIFVAVIPMIIALFSAIAFLGENFRNTIISMLESIVPPYVWPSVSGIITDETTGKSFKGQAFPPFMQNIITSGGLINSINAKG